MRELIHIIIVAITMIGMVYYYCVGDTMEAIYFGVLVCIFILMHETRGQ